MVNLWRLELAAWRLLLVPWSRIRLTLGAWSSISGPNLFQLVFIRLSSNSSVDHWPTLQLVTLNVIFFIFLLAACREYLPLASWSALYSSGTTGSARTYERKRDSGPAHRGWNSLIDRCVYFLFFSSYFSISFFTSLRISSIAIAILFNSSLDSLIFIPF